MRPKYELADIIRQYSEKFTAEHAVLKYHQKVLGAIERCRTSALGGHVERCSDCGEKRVSYNSCRNRHCPKCQGSNRNKWIQARQEDVLDCKYFHAVFTLPQCLNVFCLHYPETMYSLLFSAVKETLLAFGRDEKYLGAQLGAVAILHTWGQTLTLHPHIHLIVPAGGIDQSGNWKSTRTGGKYLFPVKAMSSVYRGKFMEGFRKFILENGMELPEDLRKAIYRKNRGGYAKRPFGGAAQVIEYPGRYTHKIAISNHRLQSIDHEKVSFTYKDYSDGGKTKIMTLDAAEFLRRFCLHILPKGFRKIRHFGLLASRNKAKLKLQQEKMKPPETGMQKPVYSNGCFDRKQCHCCKTGTMEILWSFRANAPPVRLTVNEKVVLKSVS